MGIKRLRYNIQLTKKDNNITETLLTPIIKCASDRGGYILFGNKHFQYSVALTSFGDGKMIVKIITEPSSNIKRKDMTMFDYLIIYGNKHQFSMASCYAYVTEQLAIKKGNEFLNKTIDKELFYPNAIIKAVPFGTR